LLFLGNDVCATRLIITLHYMAALLASSCLQLLDDEFIQPNYPQC